MKNLESYYNSEDEKSFCEREVSKLVCASNLVESMLQVNAEYPHSENDFEIENIINYTKIDFDAYSFAMYLEDEREDDYENIEQAIKDADEDENNELLLDYNEFMNENYREPQEVLEWWIVDEFQARSLEYQEEVILKANGLIFWGRTTSGQAIVLDGIFQNIFRKLNRGGVL